jgi:hypothetical protein
MTPRRSAEPRPYNTGLREQGGEWPGRADLEETRFAETPRGMVFAHDIIDALPADKLALIRKRADCLYSEIPWVAGAGRFYYRAGLKGRPHRDYVQALAGLIENFMKPAFIVGAKADTRILAQGSISLIALNRRPAWLAVAYADRPPPECHATSDLLAWLGATYRGVYDFSCGYGGALAYFAYAVGSDIDAKCLNYVERKILNGRNRQ